MSLLPSRILVAIAVQGFVVFGPAVPAAAAEDDISWSIQAPLAPRSLLLDVALVGNKIMAVGERGHILISEDGGHNWEQARVPTRATLSSVFLLDADHGWAVGHDAVIVATDDGGATWRRLHFAPEEERPLLDVWFADRQRGVAVGAYGFYLETSDGGLTWTSRLFEVKGAEPEPDDEVGETEIRSGAEMMDFLEDEDPISDLHLNQINQSPDGKLYIAAEAGHVFRSDDSGMTWQELPSPYDGSFYGALPVGESGVLLYGLRGNMFWSADRGATWERVDAGTDAILMGATRLSDGRPVVMGLGGTLLVARAADKPAKPLFDLFQQEDRRAIATAVQTLEGDLILVGEDGVKRLDESQYRAAPPAN